MTAPVRPCNHRPTRLRRRRMIRFSIFGIPVEVQPFFWLMCALMGGAFRADSAEAILAVALFAVAAFLSILIHELGHALTGLRLGGGRASITLTAFGGLASNQGGRFKRPQMFWMIAAGPGAGFVFFLLILGLLCLWFRSADVLSLSSYILFGTRPTLTSLDLSTLIMDKPFVFDFIRKLLWINFWWGIINLLPVMPLDGGQITNLFVTPQRRVFLIGLVASATMAALGLLWLQSSYTAILFGFLAWQNYQNMQTERWR